jgi:hypothetical protein
MQRKSHAALAFLLLSLASTCHASNQTQSVTQRSLLGFNKYSRWDACEQKKTGMRSGAP